MRLMLLALVLFAVSGSTFAQTHNLLKNPDATDGGQSWNAFGDTEIEKTPENGASFVVRNGGYFLQDVRIPLGPARRYVVFVGRGASERVDANGAITGLPYLYGYMMKSPGPNGQQILAYLQGQRMRAQPVVKDEWVSMLGVFKLAEGTTNIRFFLNQAASATTPHNGSAARFANLGLYLFDDREDAVAFASQYQ